MHYVEQPFGSVTIKPHKRTPAAKASRPAAKKPEIIGMTLPFVIPTADEARKYCDSLNPPLVMRQIRMVARRLELAMSSGTKEIRGKGKLYPQTVSFFRELGYQASGNAYNLPFGWSVSCDNSRRR